VALRAQLSHLDPAIERIRPYLTSYRPSRALGAVPAIEHAQADSTASVRPQRRVTPEILSELIKGYEAGDTTYELADRHGLNRTTVAAHLRSAHVSIRMDGLTGPQIERAADLYTAGWSLARVGRAVGADAETVRKRLRECGVTMRSPNPLRADAS